MRAHGVHFRQPGGFQRCIVQHRRHHLRAKVRRAGVVAAHGRLQLPQHAACGFAVFTDHGQAADALAVQEKILENELLTSIGIPALAMARMA
jgi:hypothetical protein